MRTYFNNLYFKLLEESGQAVVEYILVLTVVVGVVLGGLYQFNQAFAKWTDSYFGDYLACLLEAGELPSLGATGGSAGECNQMYKEFSIKDGRPMVGAGISEDGNAGETGESGSQSDGSSGGYRGGAGATVVQSIPNSGWSGGGSQRFRARSGTAAAGQGEGEDSSGKLGVGSVTDLSGYQSGKAIRIPLRDAGFSMRGGSRVEDEKDKEKKTKVDSANIAQEVRKGPQLIKVERREASTNQAPEIEEFTFGKWLRYLIIAAIIIAIILFIGGQAIQVSKSM